MSSKGIVSSFFCFFAALLLSTAASSTIQFETDSATDSSLQQQSQEVRNDVDEHIPSSHKQSQFQPHCPDGCKCSREGRRVDCSGLGLVRIPEGLHEERVEHLDLRENAIKRLDPVELIRFGALETLILNHNLIAHLDEGFLDALPRLQRLYLVRNHIRLLPKLASNTTSSLKLLDLHSNHLIDVDAHALDNLPALRRLNLAGNFLQNLPRQIFDAKNELAAVNLRFNPWNCDCRILSIVELLDAHPQLEESFHSIHGTPLRHEQQQQQQQQSLGLSGTSLAMCQNPGELRHLPLARVEREQLRCFGAKVVDVDGDQTLLRCDLSSAEYPPKVHISSQTIKWMHKSDSLDRSVVGRYEILDDGSLLLHGNAIDPATLECSVNYVLSATRQSRQTQRDPPPPHQQQQRAHFDRRRQFLTQQHQRQPQHKHHQHLRPSPPSGTPPRFTYTPRDRRFREGTAVQLNCEVIGEPKPQIRWRFNENHIEPSRKYELKKDETQLTIYPFLEHDVGRYACEAENVHGRIESSALIDLTHNEPPVITEAPQAQTARLGQRVVLRCRARGEPRPQITWFFDGSEIQFFAGGHFRVSDDGEELTLTAVGRQDAGSFSCMAGNSVGSMTADAQLHIHASQLDAIDRQLTQQTLQSIVDEASKNVDQAISRTKEELKSSVNSPQELLRHFKFAIKQPTELTRAREIYEESLRLIERHVELGLQLDPTTMPTNVSYESVLSVTHIQTMMELSGCMNGQFRDACTDMCFHQRFRTYTGQCNNLEHPTWGVSQMPFLRLLPPMYENGFNTPIGWDPNRLYNGFRKPNARSVSRELIGTEEITPHALYSSLLMQWGQFLDHDLDFIATALSRQTYMEGAHCNKTCENISPCFNIPLPPDDPRRAQVEAEPNRRMPCIEVERSAAICGSGETSPIFRQITYREQANIITSFIDASNVYGSTEVDALDLRDLFSDHGLMRFDIVSGAQKPYLPFERDSSMDCRRNFSVNNPIRCFLAGDFRANEQLGLTSMHTIWLREHNRIATKLLTLNPNWDGERIYQETRKIVGAMMQHITYSAWLPKVLGKVGFDTLIGPYKGYDPDVNPSIANAFATAAFRFGHTLINPKLERLGNNFNSIATGAIPLHEAFFAPERLLSEGGIDPILRGLFASPLKLPITSQLLNTELTEKLFHRAHNVSLDLAALNIQRGRDHGIPGYLEYRRFCNLTVPESWEELARDVKHDRVLDTLRRLYGHPANIDLWVGGIVEKRLPDALIGPTFSCIIADQFRRLRAGDRFWYENPGVFTPLQLNSLKKTSLARVICNNGDEIDRIQPDAFLFAGRQNKFAYKKCEELPEVSLKMWMHCCDEVCTAGDRDNSSGNSEAAAASRRRRTLHLYSEHESYNKKSCKSNGKLRHHGDYWQFNCSGCRCENGIIWCHALENCSFEEGEEEEV